MKSRRDSFAGPEKGQRDQNPDKIEVISVETRDRPDTEAEDGDYTVIQWDGGAYSRKNTWIMAEDSTVLGLEETR